MITPSPEYMRSAATPGVKPVTLLRLFTAGGVHVWCDQQPTRAMAGLGSPIIADGGVTAGGSETADGGGDVVLSVEAMLSGFGQMSEALAFRADDPISGLGQSEARAFSISLMNTGLLLSKVACHEDLMGAALEVWLGFSSIAPTKYLRRMRGVIESLSLTRTGGEISVRPL